MTLTISKCSEIAPRLREERPRWIRLERNGKVACLDEIATVEMESVWCAMRAQKFDVRPPQRAMQVVCVEKMNRHEALGREDFTANDVQREHENHENGSDDVGHLRDLILDASFAFEGSSDRTAATRHRVALTRDVDHGDEDHCNEYSNAQDHVVGGSCHRIEVYQNLAQGS